MSNPESGVTPPARAKRSAGAIAAWIVGGILVIGVIGYIAVGLIVSSAFPPLPDLHRPAAIVEGSVLLEPDTDPTTIKIDLAVSEGAVNAAAAGDGEVHLELDVARPDHRPVETAVGVRLPDQAAVVRPLAALEPGSDVRWTLSCSVDEECSRVLEISVGAGDEASVAQNIQWQLVAEVRPPRGTDISDDAIVTLQLSGSDQ